MKKRMPSPTKKYQKEGDTNPSAGDVGESTTEDDFVDALEMSELVDDHYEEERRDDECNPSGGETTAEESMDA